METLMSRMEQDTRGLQEAVGGPGVGAQIQPSLEHFLMHWVENAVLTASVGRIWTNLSTERCLHPAHDGAQCYIRGNLPCATLCI